MSDDGATGAIASSVSIIVVSTLMIIAMVLCLIRDQRGHTRRMRVSTSVIDICRPVRSDVNRDDSCMAEPQRPREAHLSTRQLSPSIRVVPRYEDSFWQTELYYPCGYTKSDLDLEAQSWKPAREKKIANAERSHLPSPITPPVELPNSPPPSYSQIDKSLLVAAL